MEYKGYIAVIGYDDSLDLLYGNVINAAPYPIVNFMASDVEGLKREFRISIKDYLSWCEEDGNEPAKPFPGKLELPLYQELYRRIALAAAAEGLDMDEWVMKAIEQKLTGNRFPPPSSVKQEAPSS